MCLHFVPFMDGISMRGHTIICFIKQNKRKQNQTPQNSYLGQGLYYPKLVLNSQTHNVGEDGFELMILLVLSLSAGISDIHHSLCDSGNEPRTLLS